MAVIGGEVFNNNSKNMSNVHKDTTNLLSVIITLGNNLMVGENVFFVGVKTFDLGSRSHVLKHLYNRMIFGPLDFLLS